MRFRCPSTFQNGKFSICRHASLFGGNLTCVCWFIDSDLGLGRSACCTRVRLGGSSHKLLTHSETMTEEGGHVPEAMRKSAMGSGWPWFLHSLPKFPSLSLSQEWEAILLELSVMSLTSPSFLKEFWWRSFWANIFIADQRKSNAVVLHEGVGFWSSVGLMAG